MEWISLKEAGALYSPSKTYRTLHRYAAIGLKVGTRQVRLRAKHSGGRIFTTAAWVEEFNLSLDQAREQAKK